MFYTLVTSEQGTDDADVIINSAKIIPFHFGNVKKRCYNIVVNKNKKTMKKLAKFYLVNRFMYAMLLWCAILGYCFFVSANVYVNVFVMFVGFISAMTLLTYIEEGCKLNAQEKLLLRKLSF